MTREEDFTNTVYEQIVESVEEHFDETFLEQPHIMRLLAAAKEGVVKAYPLVSKG